MASKIEKFSTIIKRCEGLMKGGFLKKKPIWYDVYAKHPPFLEPTITRERPEEMQVKEIFYAEDIERAEEFNERTNANPREVYLKTYFPLPRKARKQEEPNQ